MKLSRRRWLALSAGALLTASYPVFIERYLVQVNHYEVPVPHLPPPFVGYRIAHVTDTHLGLLVSTGFLKHVFALANDIASDLIVGTGDFVHHTRQEVLEFWPLMRKLGARDGVAAVLGNHDHWADSRESLARLEASGFSVRHRARVLERQGHRLVLAGAGDLMEDSFGLDEVLDRARPEDCRIVLAHNPDSADRTTNGRIDLMLSGHTHGGQVRLPGFGAPVLPVRNKLYDQGLIRSGQTSLFISRGIGWAVAPVRFNCAPEIAVLTLVESRHRPV